MARIVESTTDTKEEVQRTVGSFKKPEVKVESPAAPVEKTEAKTTASGTVEATEFKEKPEPKAAKESEESADDLDDVVEEGSDKEGQAAKPGKNGFKKRIDKLTKQRAAVEAERDALRAERDALKASAPKPVEKVEAQEKPDTGKPTREKFKNDADFIEALTDYKIEARQREKDSKSTQDSLRSEREKTINEHNNRVKEFAKDTPDFSEVLSDVDHINFPPALADIVLTHDRGPELMYAMAKDPDNYERISKLPPLAMAREIGKIEAKLEAPSEKESSIVETKTTRAPAPVRSLGGSAQVPKKTLDGAKSHAEYVAARRAGARR